MADQGRIEQRGTRFSWRISDASLVSYLEKRTTHETGRRRGKRITVAQIHAELEQLRDEVRALGELPTIPADADDTLRAEVTTLREALMQQRAIADALKAADEARAEVVNICSPPQKPAKPPTSVDGKRSRQRKASSASS